MSETGFIPSKRLICFSPEAQHLMAITEVYSSVNIGTVSPSFWFASICSRPAELIPHSCGNTVTPAILWAIPHSTGVEAPPPPSPQVWTSAGIWRRRLQECRNGRYLALCQVVLDAGRLCSVVAKDREVNAVLRPNVVQEDPCYNKLGEDVTRL